MRANTYSRSYLSREVQSIGPNSTSEYTSTDSTTPSIIRDYQHHFRSPASNHTLVKARRYHFRRSLNFDLSLNASHIIHSPTYLTRGSLPQIQRKTDHTSQYQSPDPSIFLAVYHQKQRYPDHACSMQTTTTNASTHNPDSDHQTPKRKSIAT